MMPPPRLSDFREIWLVDFEFTKPPGATQDPICLVAREWRSGRRIHLWQEELRARTAAPYSTADGCLFVAYYASAELQCHLALGWALPRYVLDLCVEFKCLTNGQTVQPSS